MSPNPKIIPWREKVEEDLEQGIWDKEYPRSRLIRSLYFWHKEFYGDDF